MEEAIKAIENETQRKKVLRAGWVHGIEYGSSKVEIAEAAIELLDTQIKELEQAIQILKKVK